MTHIPHHLRETACQMIADLETDQLEICLIPSTLQHQPTELKRRAVITQNPRWYQRFCAEWPKNRSRPRRKNKPDTRIVRANTIAALYEIASGRAATQYAQRLLPHVETYHGQMEAT